MADTQTPSSPTDVMQRTLERDLIIEQASQLHATWKAGQAAGVALDDDLLEAEDSGEQEEGQGFRLLDLPSEVLAHVVGCVAALERDGLGLWGFRQHHGWRGSFFDHSMPTTCALALTCRATCQIALLELWQKLDVLPLDLQNLCTRQTESLLTQSGFSSDRLHTTRSLCISGSGDIDDEWEGAVETWDDDTLRGLSRLLQQTPTLRTLEITFQSVRAAGWAGVALDLVRRHRLQLAELSILFDDQMWPEGRHEHTDYFWHSLKQLLSQQSSTLEVLALRLDNMGTCVRVFGADSVDLALLLSLLPNLRRMEYLPCTLSSWPWIAPARALPPLRALTILQSRLDWLIGGLLPAVASSLEQLSFYFDRPGKPFRKLLPSDESEASVYHFLSSESRLKMPALPQLRRLTVWLVEEYDGAAELGNLLSAFADCQQIRQLWLCAKIRGGDNGGRSPEGQVDRYFYKGLLPQLAEPLSFASVEDVFFGVDGIGVRGESVRFSPVWPGQNERRLRRECAPLLQSRDMILRIRGVEEGFDLVRTASQTAKSPSDCRSSPGLDLVWRLGAAADDQDNMAAPLSQAEARFAKQELVDLVHDRFELALSWTNNSRDHLLLAAQAVVALSTGDQSSWEYDGFEGSDTDDSDRGSQSRSPSLEL